MKQKVGTVIEAEILRRAKRQAVDQNRPLSDLIQNAMDRYLVSAMPAPSQREAAYSVFCEQPIRITTRQFKEIVNADAWDT